VNSRILLVEDDRGLVMMLTDLLRSEHYEVASSHDGGAAYDLALVGSFDLIILDITLPGKNGFNICRDLRQKGVRTPILMLTARGQLVDKVVGLKLGADDYLAKPFEEPELLARVEALLRRAPGVKDGAIRARNLEIDLAGTVVKRNGFAVSLSAKEFELLKYLVQRSGTTISRSRLLSEIWNYSSGTESRTVEVHIGLLRQKLEEDPKNPVHLVTIRGLGYKFLL
jgi:two-component system alkaline phosphatase synthesis response regulator PhoP